MELTPTVYDYKVNQLGRKYQGGVMYFLDLQESMNIRYIDTTDCDVSIWISNMHLFDTNYVFRLDAFVEHFGYYLIWGAPTSPLVNGYTIPKKVFDLEFPLPIKSIRILCGHPTIEDNHEFMLWNDNVKIRVAT